LVNKGNIMERPIDLHIEKIKTKMIKMCSLVDEQLLNAIDAFKTGNTALAALVKERDERIDRYDSKIERVIHRIIALNQPVATDLRLLLSSLKINSHIERIGDLVVNIAKNAGQIESYAKVSNEIQFDLIVEETKTMLSMAFDCFINYDPEQAKKVLSREEILDRRVEINLKKLVHIIKSDASVIDDVMHFNTTIIFLERIGDLASNIAKEVYYIISSQSLKHKDYDDDLEGFF